MLHSDALKDLLAGDLTDQEKALVCLAVEPRASRAVSSIKEIAFNAGWRSVRKKNISSLLARARGYAVRSEAGWELTTSGIEKVGTLAGPAMGSPIPKTATALRTHLSKIAHAETRVFAEEAISCFEARQLRAAVVLAWVGAVSLLQQYVASNKLAEFNAEAVRRRSGWKPARSSDDLGLMKEDEFLDVLQEISVLGKNAKQELKKALVLRNGCGHPNSLKIAEYKVAAHIEDLMLNVYAVFASAK